MSQRPRIQWRLLDGTEGSVAWTLGWLPDSSTLRWSLANSLRMEGMRDGWRDSFEAADGAELEEGWIAETDDGDTVWVDAQCETSDGTWLPNAKTATFAVLDAS